MPKESLKSEKDELLKENKKSENSTKKQPSKTSKSENKEVNSGAVKAEQFYSKQVFEDFAAFTVKSNKAMIVIYVCSAIILLCSVAMFVAGDIISGIVDVLFALFFAFYGQFIKFIMRSNNKKNYNSTDSYEFTDDTLKVIGKDSNGVEVSTATVLYSKLYAVKRYKNYGYIYLNKAVAYIVSQENFKDVIEFNCVLNKIEEAINQEKLNEAKAV